VLLTLTDLSQEPLHSQISRQLRARILGGELAEDQRLASARVFARQQRVNALSVQRAYSDLEAEGLIHPDRDEHYRIATVSAERRRDMAQQRLLETLREQEFSLKELELARDIQCRLLPPSLVQGKGFAIASRNEPARFVAGDFYDVIRHDDGSVGVVVADVAGKGIGPSLIMASVKAVMPFVAAEHSVEDTLGELNQRLISELRRREFVALAYARFEPATGRLRLANAGMPDPYLLRPGQAPEEIVAPGERLPLGMRPDIRYQAVETRLLPGERLLLLSDGMPEARMQDGDPLGYERFAEILAETAPEAGQDLSTWLDHLLTQVLAATRKEVEDDWTALAIESRSMPETKDPQTARRQSDEH
jgi:serine phosphatase RsbU (regulator of sigma subunit)